MRFVFLTIFFFNTFLSASCEDTLFAFDIPNKSSEVKIIDIVENMATECRFSVKIKDKEAKKELQQVLSLVHIENYTLKDMFDFLFTQNNIFYKFNSNKNLLSISYLETKSFIIDYVNLTNQTTTSTKNINVGISASDPQNTTGSNGSGNSDSTTVVSSSDFKFWDNLSQEIDDILLRDGDYSVESKSTINKDAGIVTITGTTDQISRIEKYLNKLKDRLHKQVLIEAKLIEVSYTDSKSKGIDWNKFNLSVSGQVNANSMATLVNGNIGSHSDGGDTSFALNFSMDGLLNFLDTYGDVNVLSTPKIMTLNNQPAVINVGDQINYQYLTDSVTTPSTTGLPITTNQYGSGSTFVGLTLNIVPEITEKGFIVLRINPVVSNMMDTNSVTIESAPDLSIKQLSSIVKAKDGARVVIGGLVSYSTENKTNKVALLSSIPILGYAFQNTKQVTIKKELIIIITPRIIDYNRFPSIESLENTMEECEDE